MAKRMKSGVTRPVLAVIAVLTLIALASVLAGCGGYSTPTSGSTGTLPATSGSNTVVEQNIAFNPTSLTVKVGDTVTFKNEDSVNHRVIVGGKDLGDQAPGSSVTWTADKAGTVPFSCRIHPSMTGQITVQ